MNIFDKIDYLVKNPSILPGFSFDPYLIPTAGNTDYTADANCQGAWLFADGLDDAATGSSGANDLSQTGAVAYSTTRPTGYTSATAKSLSLDGSTNCAQRTDANLSANVPSKHGTTMSKMAFAVWFKSTVTESERYIWTKGDHQIALQYTADWGFRVRIYDSDYSTNTIKDCGVDDTNWHHIAFSFNGSGVADGDTPANTLRTWFGGGAGVSTATTVDVLEEDSSDFVIGAKYDKSAKWSGLIFQPIIFNRCITNAQALEIYQYGINGLH